MYDAGGAWHFAGNCERCRRSIGDAVELVRSGVCQADIDDGVKVAITTGEQTRMKELE